MALHSLLPFLELAVSKDITRYQATFNVHFTTLTKTTGSQFRS